MFEQFHFRCMATVLPLCGILAISGCSPYYQKTSVFGSAKLVIQEILEKDDTYLETKYWRVVLKKDQTLPGASKIRLRRVCGDLSCVTKDEWAELHSLIIIIGDVMRESFGSTLYNLSCLMNNAYQEQPPTPLVHCHLYPRYETMVLVGEEMFIDKRFGHKYTGATTREALPKTRQIILEIMRRGLRKHRAP